jgi:hypothetical protein
MPSWHNAVTIQPQLTNTGAAARPKPSQSQMFKWPHTLTAVCEASILFEGRSVTAAVPLSLRLMNSATKSSSCCFGDDHSVCYSDVRRSIPNVWVNKRGSLSGKCGNEPMFTNFYTSSEYLMKCETLGPDSSLGIEVVDHAFTHPPKLRSRNHKERRYGLYSCVKS